MHPTSPLLSPLPRLALLGMVSLMVAMPDKAWATGNETDAPARLAVDRMPPGSTLPAPPTATTPVVPLTGRVALVLSGGGGRGIAHIGVLRALQELKVPVHMVVGTSMGALVGGAFAAGRDVEELEDFVRSTDWTAILSDRPPRQDMSFRRREEDILLPSRIEMGWGRQGLSLPPSAAGNSALEFALERLIPPQRGDLPAGQLPLPFGAIATDLLSGELMELDDAPLFLAMRASMAVPGIFTPVRVKGRPVVDGGLVRNLGIETARAMGADHIIAINVGSPLLEERDVRTAAGVTNQMLQILTSQNVERSLKLLTPSDVLIDPDLGNMSFMDFSRREQAMESGRRATLAARERLLPYVASDEAYARYESARRTSSAPLQRSLPLAELRIQGAEHTDAETLALEAGLLPGKEASLAEIQRATAELYGRGDFERIDTDVHDRDGRRHVTVHVSEAGWTQSRLRVGLELNSNLDDNNRFSLVAMHHLTWLNRWGAELRTVARVGDQAELSSEWLQPLGPGSDWYLAPKLAYDSDVAPFRLENLGTTTLLTKVRSFNGQIALGYRLGRWGDLKLGWTQTHSSFSLRDKGALDPLFKGKIKARAATLGFSVDTLDTPAFPSRGLLFSTSATHVLGGTLERSQKYELQFMLPYKADDWAGHAYLEMNHGTSEGFGNSNLGGFLRLSGISQGQLAGRSLGLARFVSAKRIGMMPIGLGGAIRAGFSLEMGAVANQVQSLRNDLKYGGSLFMAVDTRFGPFYLAAGHTRQGGSSMYLFLGPVW